MVVAAALLATLSQLGPTTDAEHIYDPGRRPDPFVSPLARAVRETKTVSGLGGMRIHELRIQGLSRLGDEPMALALASDGRGYALREGSELWDGRVLAIDFALGEVRFLERVETPDEPRRWREVVVRLRPRNDESDSRAPGSPPR